MNAHRPLSRHRLWRAWFLRVARAWGASANRGESIAMLLMAAVVGFLAGGAAVLFGVAIRWVQTICFGAAEPAVSLLRTLPAWQVALVPALGGLAVGVLATYAVDEARGHGVPEVMKALALSGGRIRGRVAVAKLVASALTIGSGGSCGREGPVIQIGAAIGSKAGQVLKMGPRRLRTLVGCGAAAGIAATFNAPIAGAVFACEVLLGGFGLTLFGPIVISSVVATMTMRYFNGPAPVFHPPACGVVSPKELVAYVLLGLAAGLVSWAYIRLNALVQAAFARLAASRPARAISPAVGGLMVGLIALVLPQVMGDGHAASNAAFSAQYPLLLLALLVVAKTVATSLTLGSGGSGGVFSPAICIGALLGAAFGMVSSKVLGAEDFAGVAAWSLVGMGGMVAGSMLAPMTAILMAFEITRTYTIVLPVMLVSCLSTVVTSLLTKDLSIYTGALAKEGIRLYRGAAPRMLRGRKAEELMRTDCARAPGGEKAQVVAGLLLSSPRERIYLVDGSGTLEGVVGLGVVRRFLLSPEAMGEVLIAEDIARKDVPTVSPDDDLSEAAEKFIRSGEDELPVVEGMAPGRLVGVLRHRDVMNALRDTLDR